MNEINILELIDERKKYPISTRENFEGKYISDKLTSNREKIGFVFPSIFLYSIKDRFLRNKLFEKYYPFALLDLSAVWKPYASVSFQLLVLSKTKPKKVILSKYTSDKTFTGKNSPFRNYGQIGEQRIEDSYKEYLQKLEECLNGDSNLPIVTDNFNIWGIEANTFETDRMLINYYDPSNMEAVAKLKKEKTLPLGELMRIYRPKKEGRRKVRVVKTKDFKYPLDYKNLSEEEETSPTLQKGDILVSFSFNGAQKFYLVDKDFDKPIYASTFLTVLHPISDKINSEYLFLYLQSNTAKKYIEMHSVGMVFQRLSHKDLAELPVILPDKITQNKSIGLFKTLFYKKEENLIQSINQQLFDKALPSKPVQEEFVLEEVEKLRIYKKELVKKVLEEDMRELNLSKQHKLYKSFLILAGSVLEAFLLDWISEIDSRDYFSEKEREIKLYQLIWTKLKEAVPDIDNKLLERADEIRKKRNLIHPRAHFNSELEIDDKSCDEVIADLRTIFKSRK